MGVYPSKTELFLPSETLLRCSPDRCWCKGSHHRGDSRYVYVERGGDGRERYHDGFDMMSQLMNGGGGGGWPAWKDPSQWNIRDMERFGEFFGEWQMREVGRRAKMHGLGGGGGYGGPGVGRGEFDRMQAEMEERFRRLGEEFSRGNEERDAFLFGSERERRKEMFQGNVLRMIQEMWPQLAQMAAAQGGGGMGMGVPGMGMGMQPPPPYGGFGGLPMGGGNMSMGGGGGGGMNWMGQMPNGMAPGMQMPQMPMHPNPMDPAGFPPRFPHRRRRNFAHADDFDEDINLVPPYQNIPGQQPWQRRRRFGDEGDHFGGIGGAASPMPRRPSGNGPRPGGLGGDGLAYDDPIRDNYAVPPYRPHDPFRGRRHTYRPEPDIIHPNPVVPPTSPRITTPLADPIVPTTPIVEPAAADPHTAAHPVAGAARTTVVPPTGIVVEETLTTDPEIGPSTRHTHPATARIFGVHIRATPVDPLRAAQRPPPYPADAALDARDRREVRFADQERARRLSERGVGRVVRAEEDLEGMDPQGNI
ncbi:hypothetical protein PRZ48_005616 [Zasmidium cellare]|uniref:Uncharacterized protein n=1 Tax=Zasmidium cellare TaxID=395010 RepID=A0ABR0EM03_ZASCE|nr:hypothetical protein PRZ48_005616 [Zasmidium cellare]